MPDLFAKVDTWFLILCGLGFLYLANRTFARFDLAIDKFNDLFSEHEKRISRLEGAHSANHGERL